MNFVRLSMTAYLPQRSGIRKPVIYFIFPFFRTISLCFSTSSGKFLLMNCPNEQSLNPNRLANDFTLSVVVPYRCMASLYFSMLRRDTAPPPS